MQTNNSLVTYDLPTNNPNYRVRFRTQEMVPQDAKVIRVAGDDELRIRFLSVAPITIEGQEETIEGFQVRIHLLSPE